MLITGRGARRFVAALEERRTSVEVKLRRIEESPPEKKTPDEIRKEREGLARSLRFLREDAKGLDAERLRGLAAAHAEERDLLRVGRLTADVGDGWMGFGERMAWLLFVSVLVCGIGISNAMLMTVTERFREIATLKCLGALDGVIMLMFVLESCFLGVVGGVAGALGGCMIGLLRMLAQFGISHLHSTPVGDLTGSMGVAVLAGVILAAVAAVYPAFRAARLAPMEAMRVE
jgi:hypothetical protein